MLVVILFLGKFFMPIYEYKCDTCAETLEKLQKMSDDPITLCPNCGEESLNKQISAAGFRLSGTGWYETDFKTNKKKNLTDSKKGSSDKKSTTQSKS
jgi:putative FmdB family regulatory protein